MYRLLETLSRAGFVARSSPHDRYCLTSQVRVLSDGFTEEDWVADIAAPLMSQLTRQLVWPVALMTFEHGHMLVRQTTHEASTLSIDYGMVGRKLPMLRTAAGRCYFALCPGRERRAILTMLAQSKAPEDRGARDPQRLTKRLDAIRAKGYEVQDREINPKTTGIAVPVQIWATRARKLVADLDIVRADNRKGRNRISAVAEIDRQRHRRRGSRSLN